MPVYKVVLKATKTIRVVADDYEHAKSESQPSNLGRYAREGFDYVEVESIEEAEGRR